MSTLAIATSSRAEWGLLKPFAEALRSQGIEVKIVATGAHLSDSCGCTWREIADDGFEIDAKIPILLDSDDALGETKSMALALEGFGTYFDYSRPDALLVLGDRYEMLAVCSAAFLARIPILHIHGGEVTEGAIDDAIRHCITKLSTLHFTSTEEYRRRVIQLGEDPSSVFNVGAVGVENVLHEDLLSKQELFSSLGLPNLGDYVVLTYHPVTLSDGDATSEMRIVLDALNMFGDMEIVATKANADAGGRAINAALLESSEKDPRLHVFSSLGSKRYLSALKYASAVVGNSSSGILEAPAFGVPTVNIGDRQKGRIRPATVIDTALDLDSIGQAIRTALSPDFASARKGFENPYGKGNTSKAGARIIAAFLNSPSAAIKSFYDIPFESQPHIKADS